MNREIKEKNMRQLAEYREHLRKHPDLKYLFFELTNRCNMNCIHCGSNCTWHNNVFLSYESIKKVLESVADNFPIMSVMICLTGGEPLLHPDFERIAALICQMGFPWGITSNGILIDENIAAMLKLNNLGSITLSIDGTKENHDSFRKCPGAYDKTMAAVEYLHKNNIPVQVTTVVHKGNIEQLDEVFAELDNYNIESWKIVNIEPIGRALEHNELSLNDSDYVKMFDYIHDKRFSPCKMDVRYGCTHYLTVKYEHELRDNYFICGSGIYSASILCNGDIFSCLDIERRPELIQGNIDRDDFVDVWKNKFQIYREDRTAKCSECSQCKDKQYCAADSTHTWDFNNSKPMICIKKMIENNGDV